MRNPIKVTVIGFDGPYAICSFESEDAAADLLADAEFIRKQGFRPGDSFLWIPPEEGAQSLSDGVITERMPRCSRTKRDAMKELRKMAGDVPRYEVVLTENNREYFQRILDSIGDPDREEG
ncbi:MAG TPA: hypothetical protein VFT82_03410 [Candidatus Paceibacterota bacterium]|nr:hypothetical protein [Candidatus Paceibacterota bacterium]